MPRGVERRDHRGITETPHPAHSAPRALASPAGDPAGTVAGTGPDTPASAPPPGGGWPPGTSPTGPPPWPGGHRDWRSEGFPRHGRYPPGDVRGPYRRGPRRLHGRGPWRRSIDDRIFAGVAGGVGRHFGIDATVVRIGFVIATLAGGWGLTLYVGAWLLMPLDGRDESIGSRVVRDRQGMLLALSFVPALIVVLALASAMHIGYVTSLSWSVFLFGAGGVLLWRNSDAEERAWLREAADPVVHLEGRSSRSWRRMGLRVGLAAVLLLGGVACLVVHRAQHSGVLRLVIGTLLVVAAVVVLFGPWWLRLLRDLMTERQARQRAEDRADMAARVHDSVLQTLALIQRASDDPQRIVQLARSQERELRAWLFEGDIPAAVGEDVATLAAGVQLVANEVEERHGVPVEVVTVGDCRLDDPLRAVLDAAREAAVNAAKWSGAPVISLFAEVEPTRVSVFVRDRGRGFDPDTVASDRHGIAESIQARMVRNGGRAQVRAAVGDGTEVELVMPRDAAA